MISLNDVLLNYPSEQREQWIKALKGPPPALFEIPNVRVGMLAKKMANPARVQTIVGHLDKRTMLLLRYVCARGGVVSGEDLETEFPLSADLLEGLVRSFLLFKDRGFFMLPGEYFKYFKVEEKTKAVPPISTKAAGRKRLVVARPAVLTTEMVPSSDSPHHLESFGLRFLWDLKLFRAALAAEAIRETQNGNPDRRSLGLFLKSLGILNLRYGDFLLILGGFLKQESPSPTHSMRAAVERWVILRSYLESSPSRSFGSNIKADNMVGRRKILLNTLTYLPVGQWVSFSLFFERLATPEWKELSRNPDYFQMSTHRVSKEVAETTLAESLLWLGIVEAGYSNAGESDRVLTHLRLTPWGRFYLEEASGEFPGFPSGSVEDKIILLPQLEVAVPPGVRGDLLKTLFRLGVLSGPNTIVLKKEMIGEAILGGFSPEHILRFFKDHSKTEIPETFHRLLADLGRKMGQIKVGGARTYVTVKDPHLAREIIAHRAVQALGPTPVGDGVILFAKAGVGDVIKLLKKMGHFPEG